MKDYGETWKHTPTLERGGKHACPRGCVQQSLGDIVRRETRAGAAGWRGVCPGTGSGAGRTRALLPSKTGGGGGRRKTPREETSGRSRRCSFSVERTRVRRQVEAIGCLRTAPRLPTTLGALGAFSGRGRAAPPAAWPLPCCGGLLLRPAVRPSPGASGRTDPRRMAENPAPALVERACCVCNGPDVQPWSTNTDARPRVLILLVTSHAHPLPAARLQHELPQGRAVSHHFSSSPCPTLLAPTQITGHQESGVGGTRSVGLAKSLPIPRGHGGSSWASFLGPAGDSNRHGQAFTRPRRKPVPGRWVRIISLTDGVQGTRRAVRTLGARQTPFFVLTAVMRTGRCRCHHFTEQLTAQSCSWSRQVTLSPPCVTAAVSRERRHLRFHGASAWPHGCSREPWQVLHSSEDWWVRR